VIAVPRKAATRKRMAEIGALGGEAAAGAGLASWREKLTPRERSAIARAAARARWKRRGRRR